MRVQAQTVRRDKAAETSRQAPHHQNQKRRTYVSVQIPTHHAPCVALTNQNKKMVDAKGQASPGPCACLRRAKARSRIHGAMIAATRLAAPCRTTDPTSGSMSLPAVVQYCSAAAGGGRPADGRVNAPPVEHSRSRGRKLVDGGRARTGPRRAHDRMDAGDPALPCLPQRSKPVWRGPAARVALRWCAPISPAAPALPPPCACLSCARVYYYCTRSWFLCSRSCRICSHPSYRRSTQHVHF